MIHIPLSKKSSFNPRNMGHCANPTPSTMTLKPNITSQFATTCGDRRSREKGHCELKKGLLSLKLSFRRLGVILMNQKSITRTCGGGDYSLLCDDQDLRGAPALIGNRECKTSSVSFGTRTGVLYRRMRHHS